MHEKVPYEGGAYRGDNAAELELWAHELATAAEAEELVEVAMQNYATAQRRLDLAKTTEEIELALFEAECARKEIAKVEAARLRIDWLLFNELGL